MVLDYDYGLFSSKTDNSLVNLFLFNQDSQYSFPVFYN